MRAVIAERLDMLPWNKQIGFFSDAYVVEWAYAKAAMVRKQIAYVLAEQVAQGQHSWRALSRSLARCSTRARGCCSAWRRASEAS